MSIGFAQYPARSEQLATASRRLMDSIEDRRINRNIVIQSLENAAQTGDFSAEIRRFSEAPSDPGPRPPVTITAEDALAGVLLELQSANALISAGIALNEHEGGSEVTLLKQSVQHIETSRADVVRPLTAADLRFAPATNVASPDLNAAAKSFRDNAKGVLDDIVVDTVSVITGIFDQLKKLDGAQVLQGIQNLGASFQSISAAGRLIRQGLTKLKSAMEAITSLFGKDAIDHVKGKVKAIWDKFAAGDYTRDAVAWLLDIDEAGRRIEASLTRNGLGVGAVDAASNELPALSASFKKNVKICRALVEGVVLAGTILGFLHVVAPWIPLAFAGVYGALIASAILIGMNYAGSGRLLHWMRGVAVIADGIQPAAPPAVS